MISYNRNSLDVASRTAAVWQLDDLRAAADDIIVDGAQSGSEQALAEILAAEHEREKRESYSAGFIAGQLAAASAAESQMRGAIDALRSAAAHFMTVESAAMGVLEDNLSALAVSIARQIIGKEVRTAPEIVVDLVRFALTEFPVDQPLRIRINPIDLSTLSAATGGSAIRIAPDREIAWLADARILQGGCVVEGRERIIDGRVDTALERTYRALTQTGA